MGQQTLRDRAKFSGTCQSMFRAWKAYLFGAEDYGSCIAHRYLGAHPTASDWRAVTRELTLTPDAAEAPSPEPHRHIFGHWRKDWPVKLGYHDAVKSLMALAKQGPRADEQPALWLQYRDALRL
ncbi:MAG: hypothetical protein EOO40_08525 [Deltaproteobacteria bacterium]|nr:MAG: hypothetical protein EOO40_08525 [Deltaproteobacteria bacterium]